jgi:hypothetical protein
MADAIEVALNEHFYQTPIDPSDMESAMMSESDYDWERKGDPITFVIEESAEIEREPAEDIQEVLETRHSDFERAQMGDEQPFEEEAHYAKRAVDIAESQAGWFHFENLLKTQARYFSRAAEEILREIFEGISEHKTHDGKAVVVEAGPEKSLREIYRARVFQSDEKLEEALKRPDRDIGPPHSLAAPTGRMNAHGISVFYGATDPRSALAEVRPPVGSKVVVARFEFLRAVRLLDVEALRSLNVTGSLFDMTYKRSQERAKFLNWLSGRITMPVMPDDEPFDYLATQAVADFLATNTTPPLDGILYPSVQAGEGNLNIVLFHRSSSIQSLALPEGTKIESRLYEQYDDGLEIDPWVWEAVPPKSPSSEEKPIDLDGGAQLLSESLDSIGPEEYEARTPVLRLDTGSLKVHIVKRVNIDTKDYSVHRHRTEKSSFEF